MSLKHKKKISNKVFTFFIINLSAPFHIGNKNQHFQWKDPKKFNVHSFPFKEEQKDKKISKLVGINTKIILTYVNIFDN